jgi:hypothetical protein
MSSLRLAVVFAALLLASPRLALGAPVELTVEQIAIGPTDPAGATATVQPGPLFSGLAFLEGGDVDLAGGASPVRLSPLRREVRWQVTAPAGWELEDPSDDLELRLGAVHISRRLLSGGDGVEVVWQLDIGAGSLTGDELVELREALAAGGLGEPLTLQFTPRWLGLVDEGSAAAAVAEAREAMARAPGDLLTHASWVELLGRLGMIDASIEAATALADLHAESPVAATALVHALQRGVDARLPTGPAPVQAARAAALRAIGLSPADGELNRLAVALLCRPPEDPAACDQGLALADAWLSAHPGDEAMRTLRDDHLLRRGLWRRLDRAPGPEASAHAWGAAVASVLVDGTAEEAAAVLQRVPEPVRRTAFVVAYSALAAQPRSGPPLALFRWMETWWPDAPGLSRSVALLSRETPWREVVPAGDPRATVLELFEAAIIGKAPPATLIDERGLSRAAGASLVIAAARRSRPPTDYPMHLAVSILAPDLVVADEIGRDARLLTLVTPGFTTTSWALVRHKGVWRVRAVTGQPGPAGLEAADALAKGDEAAARTWLRWAELLGVPVEGNPMLERPWVDLVPGGVGADLTWPITVLSALAGDPDAVDALIDGADAVDPDTRALVLPLVAHLSAWSGSPEDLERLQRAYASPHFPRSARLGLLWHLFDVDPDLALGLLRALVEAHPTDPVPQLHLAQLLTLQGLFEEADRVWSTFTAQGLDDVGRNNHAWSLLFLGRPTEALTLLVAMDDPMEPYFLHTRAAAHLLAGQIDEAWMAARLALASRGALDPAWHVVLAGLAAALGLPEQALLHRQAVPASSRDDQRLVAQILDHPPLP